MKNNKKVNNKKAGLIGLVLGVAGCYTQQNYLSHVNLGPEPTSKIAYLNKYVTKNGGDEFVVCLYGSVSNDTLRITSSYLPPVVLSSPTEVKWITCPNNINQERYVGVVHSHPGRKNNACYPSKTDVKRALNDKRTLVEVITCDDGIKAWDRIELNEVYKNNE